MKLKAKKNKVEATSKKIVVANMLQGYSSVCGLVNHVILGDIFNLGIYGQVYLMMDLASRKVLGFSHNPKSFNSDESWD